MYQKRFLLGSQPQIRITGVAGDIEISGQEGEEIRLETDVLGDVNTKDNILLLEGMLAISVYKCHAERTLPWRVSVAM